MTSAKQKQAYETCKCGKVSQRRFESEATDKITNALVKFCSSDNQDGRNRFDEAFSKRMSKLYLHLELYSLLFSPIRMLFRTTISLSSKIHSSTRVLSPSTIQETADSRRYPKEDRPERKDAGSLEASRSFAQRSVRRRDTFHPSRRPWNWWLLNERLRS